MLNQHYFQAFEERKCNKCPALPAIDPRIQAKMIRAKADNLLTSHDSRVNQKALAKTHLNAQQNRRPGAW